MTTTYTPNAVTAALQDVEDRMRAAKEAGDNEKVNEYGEEGRRILHDAMTANGLTKSDLNEAIASSVLSDKASEFAGSITAASFVGWTEFVDVGVKFIERTNEAIGKAARINEAVGGPFIPLPAIHLGNNPDGVKKVMGMLKECIEEARQEGERAINGQLSQLFNGLTITKDGDTPPALLAAYAAKGEELAKGVALIGKFGAGCRDNAIMASCGPLARHLLDKDAEVRQMCQDNHLEPFRNGIFPTNVRAALHMISVLGPVLNDLENIA